VALLNAAERRPPALCFVLGAALAALSCSAPPLVLTEVPNQPSGHRFVALGAERSGCAVTAEGEGGLLIRCPQGLIHVPTFSGPPTLAVRCLEGEVAALERCRAHVRTLLLAADAAETGR
jgi:hypothetical protein